MAVFVKLDAYIRVSQVGDREGESFISPDAQRDAIQGWALANDVEIGEWQIDLDESGGTFDRPAFNRLMQRVEDGSTAGVVVARLDRFGRSLLDALTAKKRVKEAGCIFVSAAEGTGEGSNGNLQHNLLLSFAEFQKDLIGDNWRVARDRAIARGVHCGPVPFGYMKNQGGRLVPSQAAEHVTKAFSMRAEGRKLREICDYLNAVASPRRGAAFVPTTVTRMFTRRTYLGELRSGEFVNLEAHEPLVDPQTFALCQPKGRKWSSEAKYLLPGIIRCAGCRHTLRYATSPGDYNYYRCVKKHASGDCTAPAHINAEPIEEFVSGIVLPQLAAIPDTGSMVDARTELDAATRALETYRDDVDTYAVLGHQKWLEGLKPRADAVETAQARFRSASAAGAGFDVGHVRSNWETLATPEKRPVLLSMLDCVFVRGDDLPEDAFVCWSGERPDPMPGRGTSLYRVTPFEW